MKSAALIPLLPLLAALAIEARPHDQSRHLDKTRSVRKSLSFGPDLAHSTFESAPDYISPLVKRAEPIDVKRAASAFIGSKVGGAEGESFYIRPDTYTDARTGVTHVYARQLLNGLEVSDGDINVNIDRDGRILSWGNSFHPGPAPTADLQSSRSRESERVCPLLKDQIAVHKAHLKALKASTKEHRGPWELIKSASQVFLGGAAPSEHKLRKEASKAEISRVKLTGKKLKQHYKAMCKGPASVDLGEAARFLSPEEALVSLLQRVGDRKDLSDLSLDITSHPQPTLQTKEATAEPPTQIISGEGLARSGVTDHVPVRLMYTQTSTGEPRMVWKMEVQMKDNWYEAYVDVTTGEILRSVDWAHDYSWGPQKGKVRAQKDHKDHKQKPLPVPAPPKNVGKYTYQVFPWGINDPTTGNLTLATKPWDTTASPLGWHEFPTSSSPWPKLKGQHDEGNTTVFATTAGNNVIAHEDWEGQNNYLQNYRPVTSRENMTFIYDYGEPDGLAPKEYVDFVVTQLFYTSNMYHDLTYRLGFDEAAGNFQAYNFGLGGKGGDPVIANAQDGSGYNNANFATPPDGQSGRMRMYLWDTATPFRDGDLEAGIIIHELSHGLSTRLTGGPANSACLPWGESGGMGEGWGDALATLIRQIEERKSFPNLTETYGMGAWAANRPTGIRNFKYSTNSTDNPSTYKLLDKPGYWGVHAIGEVWAELLFVVSSRLIEKYGFSPTLFPPIDTSVPNDYYTLTSPESVDAQGRPIPLVPKHGNTLAMQLIINGMKLQPCRPSFFDARDSIIQADEVLTGGANACLIWKAFAERGLGQDAKVIGQTPWGGGIRTDGFHVPAKACKAEKPGKPDHGDDE